MSQLEAVVSQLDDQDSGQGWCVEEIESVQGCGGTGCELCTPTALQCSQGRFTVASQWHRF